MWWATKCKQYVTFSMWCLWVSLPHSCTCPCNKWVPICREQYYSILHLSNLNNTRNTKGPKHNLILSKVRTSMAKNVLNFSAASSWNKLQRYQRITFNQCIFTETDSSVPEMMCAIDNEHNPCENNIYIFFVYKTFLDLNLFFKVH